MNEQKVEFLEDKIITEDGQTVMMSWETPVMINMANQVCKNGGHIIEIGFGMGISATEIQNQSISSHTIIESNPQIYQKALDWAVGKTNVTIIFDDFSNYIDTTTDKFDGVFFDAFPSEILGIGDDNFTYGKVFFDKIKRICNPGCRVVPFLMGCAFDLNYLIEYVPLSNIEIYDYKLNEFIKTHYFRGDEYKVFVFNI